MIDVEMTPGTYELHLELCNLLLVFASSQMHAPFGMEGWGHSVFLETLLCGRASLRAGELVKVPPRTVAPGRRWALGAMR